jgi:hypothetical protein
MPISPNGNSETILKKHHSELKWTTTRLRFLSCNERCTSST